MPELNELTVIPVADVSDDDLLLIYDMSAGSENSKACTRGDMLKDVARDNGDHDFGTSEIDDLTATAATLVDATITQSLAFDGAATLTKLYRATAAINTAGTADGAGETLTATVTGCAAGDFLAVSFTDALPDGLSWQAWVSGADTVSIRFINQSGGAVGSDTYTAKIVAMRFS